MSDDKFDEEVVHKNKDVTPPTIGAHRQYVSDIAFTDTIKRIQEKRGSRKAYARMETDAGWADRITPDLASFIANRDSFYLATANAQGQPYIQHRGGTPGFLKVLGPDLLGFADLRGNRQFVTLGNLEENPKAFIFLMDYPNRRRIKIWGEAAVIANDPALFATLTDEESLTKVEQAILFTVKAWDVNCPQYITPRFSALDIAAHIAPLENRIAELEAELQQYRPQS